MLRTHALPDLSRLTLATNGDGGGGDTSGKIVDLRTGRWDGKSTWEDRREENRRQDSKGMAADDEEFAEGNEEEGAGPSSMTLYDNWGFAARDDEEFAEGEEVIYTVENGQYLAVVRSKNDDFPPRYTIEIKKSIGLSYGISTAWLLRPKERIYGVSNSELQFAASPFMASAHSSGEEDTHEEEGINKTEGKKRPDSEEQSLSEAKNGGTGTGQKDDPYLVESKKQRMLPTSITKARGQKSSAPPGAPERHRVVGVLKNSDIIYSNIMNIAGEQKSFGSSRKKTR